MAIPNVIQTTLKVTGLSQVLSAAKQYDRAIKGMATSTQKAAKDMNDGLKATAANFQVFLDGVKSLGDITRLGGFKDQVDAITDLRNAWNELGKNVKVNVDIFNEAITQGADITEAFRLATGGADEAAGKINLLGVSLSKAAVAVGVATVAIAAMAAALKTTIKVVEQSVNVFKEIVGQSNLLRLELGLTIEEASGLRLAALETNTSFTTLSTTIVQFDRRLTDLRLRFAQGEDVNNSFTRSLTALGFSVEDLATTTRPTIEIFEEINDALREVTPSSEAAGLAVGIYGRSVRGILPFIQDAIGGTEEFAKRARELGVVVTEVDRIALRDFIKASADLAAAISGLALVVARHVIPALTGLAEHLTKVATLLRKAAIFAIAAANGLLVYITSLGDVDAALAQMAQTLNKFNAILDDATKENLALADAQRDLAISAINARLEEQALADELQDALGRLADLRAELGVKLLEIQIRSDQQVEDAFRRHWRRVEDIERRWDQRVLDARTKFLRAREDAFIRESQRLRDLVDERQRRISNLEEDFRFKREDLERKHRDKLEDIQTKFLDTVQEAARSNDAVAVVRAIRQRARDTRDAETKRGRDIRDLDIDLERRRKRINDDAKKREDAQKRRLQDELDRARLQYDRQLEDLRESLRRQREEAGLAWRRRQADIETNRRRQEAATLRWYKRQLDDLREALGLQGAEIDRAIRGWGTIAAAATVSAINTMGAAALAAQRAWARRILLSSSAGLGGTSGRTSGGRGHRRAEGGIDIVNRPTTFLAGEAGPEIAAFIPLRGSMNISHNFSRLGVDINGAGGMSTGQVESIVYAAMISLAQRLESKVVR